MLEKICWCTYMYTLKWNFKIEPFVVQYVVQKEEGMHMLRLEVGHKLFWGVVEMEKQQCQFKLRVLEENDSDVVL
jgi:hypothetical protein